VKKIVDLYQNNKLLFILVGTILLIVLFIFFLISEFRILSYTLLIFVIGGAGYLQYKNKYLSNQQLFLIGAFLILSLISLLPVIRADYWPYSHEEDSYKARTLVYADHFKQLDFIPLWSSADSFGMGTPLPLFYHKFFYYISAFLYLLIGSFKYSFLASYIFFFAIGAFGAYKTLRLFKLKPIPSFLIAISIIFLNYTVTNWLIRGAVAEFSAMMFVPWVIWWCTKLLLKYEFSMFIVPIFFLTFISHSVIAFYSIPLFILAFALYIVFSFKEIEWKKLLIKGTSAFALLVLCLSIYLFPMFLLRNNYSPSKITDNGFTPATTRVLPDKYFTDEGYRWGEDYVRFTLVIDPPVLYLLGLTFGISTFYLFRNFKNKSKSNLKRNILLVIWILSIIGIYTYMQTEHALFIYDEFQVLNFIQFSWRLLAFISPLMVILLGYFLSRIKNQVYQISIAAILIISQIVLGHSFSTIQYKVFSKEKFESVPYRNYEDGLESRLAGIGEYLPLIPAGSSTEYDSNRALYFSNLKKEWLVIPNKNSECTMSRKENKFLDQLSKEYTLSCSESTIVALPINFSGYERVFIKSDSDSDFKEVEKWRGETDPRIFINAQKGNSEIKVEFMSYRTIPIVIFNKLIQGK